MKKLIRNKLCLIPILFLVMLSMCACKDSERGKVVFTTALGKDEVFRIGEVSCTYPEYMLYLTNIQNKYEKVYGQQIWGVRYGDITFEDNVKDIVLAQIAQMKSVYLLAQEKGVNLTEEEEGLLREGAAQYYASLSQAERETLQVTEDIIFCLYRENALADKVYREIVSQVNPEISDDEARTVTVDQIFLKNYFVDSKGEVIEYTREMKENKIKLLQEIREKVESGETGFAEMAGRYNEEESIRISFKKGEKEARLEEAAFHMQTDQVSEVIETSEGYYLLKCITTFDRKETDANKLLLIEERKKEAFGNEYDDFVNTLARKLNDSLWQKIELIHMQEVDTDNFFEVYEGCLEKFYK